MITNTGNQLITKFLLGQAPEYAGYIAVGVGAEPLGITGNDDTSPTKKSMEFEAFRVPILSKGLVSDNITVDISNWAYDSFANYATVTTSSAHNIKIDDEVTILFSNSLYFSRNGTFKVTGTNGTDKFYYIDPNMTSTTTWSVSSGNTATVSYFRERIIFKGELPSDQKYEMSEIAVFPSQSNSLALSYDSKIIGGFLPGESWVYSDGITNTETAIDSVSNNIGNTNGNITSLTFVDSNSIYANALFVNSDNLLFEYTTSGSSYPRKARQEVPRLYNKSLIVRGDLSNFTSDDMNLNSTAYITTEQQSFDFKNYSPNDYIKTAFSVISSTSTTAVTPSKIRFRIEFLNINDTSTLKAVAKQVINTTSPYYTQIENGNRYIVLSKQLKDFSVDIDFSWARVNSIRIYIQTLNGSDVWDSSYISFDGLRIDNENTINPLYGMVAYSRLRNQQYDTFTITKGENTLGYIEYRLGLGII